MVSKKVSDSVLKKFGIEKSIGFGIEKIWYKKVADSVSKKIDIKKYRIWYWKYLVSKKSCILNQKKLSNKSLAHYLNINPVEI